MFKDKRLNKTRIAQWNDAAKLLTRQSLREIKVADDPQSHWVWVRNDSGSDRERYECMALSDPIFDLELDGSVDLMFKAIASDPNKTPVILLEPIADGEMGRAIIHGLALAKVGVGSIGARRATPGTNKLTPGIGSIKLLGSPSTSADTLLPVLLNGCCIQKNWVGFLYASYRGPTIGFWVVPSFALEGELPSGPQWVVNLYKWNFGVAGATIRVEEDPFNDRWIPLQQEYICPDGRTVPPPPPPPPAEPPVYE